MLRMPRRVIRKLISTFLQHSLFLKAVLVLVLNCTSPSKPFENTFSADASTFCIDLLQICVKCWQKIDKTKSDQLRNAFFVCEINAAVMLSACAHVWCSENPPLNSIQSMVSFTDTDQFKPKRLYGGRYAVGVKVYRLYEICCAVHCALKYFVHFVCISICHLNVGLCICFLPQSGYCHSALYLPVTMVTMYIDGWNYGKLITWLLAIE